MSEKEKQNRTGKENSSDGKKIESLDAGIDSNDNEQEFPGSSEIPNHNLDQYKDTEVNSSDVIAVEQLSNESLDFSESSESTVIYEFPSDYESEYDSYLSQACDSRSRENSELLDCDKSRATLTINKTESTEIVDTKTLNKDVPDSMCNAGIWQEFERKRKKSAVSLLKNKRHKEVKDSCNPAIQISQYCEGVAQVDDLGYTSGELADSEDNVKDSASSDSSDSNYANETATPLQNIASGIQRAKRMKKESIDENKTGERNGKATTSNSRKTPAEASSDKGIVPSVLKGEILPVFKLSDESKKKFEKCMPTILEVRESNSHEDVSQSSQSKKNPLKMKAKVGKRSDKCNVCNVRLGLCAIQCRCGGYYCAKHRYDKEHNCTFDYKSMGAAEIRKNNPKVTAEKIRKL